LGTRESYKSDSKKKQTDAHKSVREQIYQLLCGERGEARFGFRIVACASLCDDATGDALDALLCAAQAAWGWHSRIINDRASGFVDPLEGWICDPVCGPSAIRTVSPMGPKDLDRSARAASPVV
jgi:hypothetical protein